MCLRVHLPYFIFQVVIKNMPVATPEMQSVADAYVLLKNKIHDKSQALTDMRKELKKIDTALLDEMKIRNINEVSSNGVVISLASKLIAK